MTEAAQHKRAANAQLGELLQIADLDRPIAFFCECDDPTCYRPVWLTSAEYEWKRAESPALAPSHRSAGAELQTAA